MQLQSHPSSGTASPQYRDCRQIAPHAGFISHTPPCHGPEILGGCSHVLWRDNTPAVCTRDELQLENQGESGSVSVLYLHKQETSPDVHQFGQSTLAGFHKPAKVLPIASMMLFPLSPWVYQPCVQPSQLPAQTQHTLLTHQLCSSTLSWCETSCPSNCGKLRTSMGTWKFASSAHGEDKFLHDQGDAGRGSTGICPSR